MLPIILIILHKINSSNQTLYPNRLANYISQLRSHGIVTRKTKVLECYALLVVSKIGGKVRSFYSPRIKMEGKSYAPSQRSLRKII